MIQQPTVFVLGAGASYPYGFPLGPQLRQTLVTQTTQPGSAKFQFLVSAGFAPDRIQAFGDALARSWSSSVDSFLSSRLDLADVGKAAILHSLAGCEIEEHLFKAKPEEDWFRHLWRFMHADATDATMFTMNTVKFITFNYDRSVEHAFTIGIMHAYGLSEENAAKHVPKVSHVYGALGRYWPFDPTHKLARPYGQDIAPNNLKDLSDAIRVIPELKSLATDARVAANRHRIDYAAMELQHILEDAERLIFLGFSYDPDNLERLRLFTRDGKPHWLKKECAIFASAMGIENVDRQVMNRYFGPSGYRLEIGESESNSLRFLRRYVDFSRG